MNTESNHKKIVLINTVLYGSTGSIVRHLKALAEENGMQVYTASAYARKTDAKYGDKDIIIGNYFDRYLHLLLSRVTGLSGVYSLFATHKLVRRLGKIDPDVIHLHNLHNAYINLPILFRYIKKNNKRVIWTLHDCWPFTGRCPHFMILRCEKWKDGCFDCPYPKESYPISYRDSSKRMWTIKKNAFTGVNDMTIVTPSEWLAGLIDESFLKEYPVKVINNGIDLEVFRPTRGDLFNELGKESRHIVLGIAMDWNYRKGLDVFKELPEQLGDKYRVVMVGTDDALAENLKKLGIKCINRTSSRQELAEIYTAADVFVNPTREDTFPTVNIEALACGTPVITFDTGGSPEIIDESCGLVVQNEDTNAMAAAIKKICEEKPFSSEKCMARAKLYRSEDCFKDYLVLYGVADVRRKE